MTQKINKIREDEKKPETVAILTERRQAIDFTPIYYIRLLRRLEKGTVLIFDSSNYKIIAEEND